MNFEQANAVSIISLLEKLGFNPARVSGNDYYYLSPIRNERTASFHVNAKKNLWFDHGTGIGGNCVAFIRKWLKFTGENSTDADVLRWVNNMSGLGQIIIPVNFPAKQEQQEQEKNLVIKSIQPINEQALIDYLISRGIPLDIGREYLKEVRTYNKRLKKHFFALGFANESDGYELRNKYVKQNVNGKDVSFIRGTQPKPPGVHVFEGFMDFLTVVVLNKKQHLRDDALILNSVSNLKKGMELIKGYGYQVAYTWLHNDKAGNQSLSLLDDFLKAEKGLLHQPMNRMYSGYKDVNEWHMAKLKL